MYIGLYVKCQLFLPDINKTWIFLTHFFEIFSNIRFHENLSSGRRVIPQTHRQIWWRAQSLFAILRLRLKSWYLTISGIILPSFLNEYAYHLGILRVIPTQSSVFSLGYLWIIFILNYRKIFYFHDENYRHLYTTVNCFYWPLNTIYSTLNTYVSHMYHCSDSQNIYFEIFRIKE